MNGATKTETSAVDKGGAKGARDSEEGVPKCQGEREQAKRSPWMNREWCVAF